MDFESSPQSTPQQERQIEIEIEWPVFTEIQEDDSDYQGAIPVTASADEATDKVEDKLKELLKQDREKVSDTFYTTFYTGISNSLIKVFLSKPMTTSLLSITITGTPICPLLSIISVLLVVSVPTL